MADPPFTKPLPSPGSDPNAKFTSGNQDTTPKFDDTFFGPNDKRYIDRKARDMSRLRGVDAYYYKLNDSTQRIDGVRPLTDGPEVERGLTTSRRSGNVSLYGEPIVIKKRIDSTSREVIPDWNFSPPVKVRTLGMEPLQEEEPDARGSIFTYKLKLHVARVLLDEVNIIPRVGDVIHLPSLLNSYYDVVHVDRDKHRFGATGFAIAYYFDLVRNSLFEPERKLDGGT
jgi:hypothetical protein